MHQTLWPEHDFQGATGLMCISLRLKNQPWLAHIFLGQTVLCTYGTIKRNSLQFCRYNKPSASA